LTPLRLIELARGQPEVAIDRDVRIPGPTLTARLQSGRPLLVSELEAHPDQHRERRRYRYGHVLGQGLDRSAIVRWQERHSDSPLAADVIDLLVHVDGIHLWADLDRARSYFGIRPLEEWRDTRDDQAHALLAESRPGTLVISYHDNGDYFLLLEPSESRFTWFDPQSPDDSESIGSSVSTLLDWWWDRALEMDPRKDMAP
jgi:hypothetical protein